MENKLEDIFNYLLLDDRIATGGQPTVEQMQLIKDAGYQIIINLALTTSDNALPNEKAVVESLEMIYIHIPIDFDRPTIADFNTFIRAMQTNQTKKIFIHCAANFRVSAFMYLYRTLYQNMDATAAKTDLNKFWQPNPTWQNLIEKITDNRANAFHP